MPQLLSTPAHPVPPSPPPPAPSVPSPGESLALWAGLVVRLGIILPSTAEPAGEEGLEKGWRRAGRKLERETEETCVLEGAGSGT